MIPSSPPPITGTLRPTLLDRVLSTLEWVTFWVLFKLLWGTVILVFVLGVLL